MNQRIHVFYSGLVQGVGFRFTVERIAIQLGVNGWVRNLSNGQVEVVAECSRERLDEFLDQINRYFKKYIHNIEIDWQPATNEFKEFNIAF